MNTIKRIFEELLRMYGPQGWWPLLDCKGSNPTKTGSMRGYHPGDYSYPRNESQRFEICIGAILTQNTSWVQVEKALTNLKELDAINPKRILKLGDDELKNAIRPAGYFNQKSKKLRSFSRFYLSLNGKTPSREELLNVWGVGRETADSILLYAFKFPTFVVDAYTKRIFINLGFIKEKDSYDEIKYFFEMSEIAICTLLTSVRSKKAISEHDQEHAPHFSAAFLDKNIKEELIIYQEFHALIVEHAKRLSSNRLW